MVTFSKINTVANQKRRCQLKCRWALDEDELLMKLVKRHGPGNWKHIAYHMNGKSGRSCRLRWINQLNPKVDRTPFGEEESQRILELHEKHGNKWSIIASHFKGRTDNQVKNQYHILVGRKNTKPSGAFCGPIKSGFLGSPFLYGNMSTDTVGSQFPDDPCQGNDKMMPLFDGGSSSAYANGETWLGLHYFSAANNIHPHQGICRRDSMMSDANSSAFSEFCPVPQPQQGLETKDYMMSDANSAVFSEYCPVPQPQQEAGTKDYQFIDFMGVGSSE